MVLSGIAPVSITMTLSGDLSSGRRNRKHGSRSATLTKTAAIGGDMLAVKGTDAQEVAKLIMATTEPGGRHEASEAAHTSYPSLDPAMVLFQSVVQINIGSGCTRLAELDADRLRIGVVTIAGDPIGNHPSEVFADQKNALAAARSRCLLSITSTRGAISVDCPIEITRATGNLDVGFVDIPARCQSRRQRC